MDIAKLCRICETNPTDDFVTKRAAAIKDLKTIIGKKKLVNELLEIGNAVCEVFNEVPNLPENVYNLIVVSIKKSNVSFDPEDRQLDIAVCGISAVLNFIESSSSSEKGLNLADVLAYAIWSGTDFIQPLDNTKLEELRIHASKVARERILKSGLTSRDRKPVANVPVAEDATLPPAAKAVQSAISTLRYNSALDREEIDLLWWILSERSEILEKPLSTLSSTNRAVLSGIETGLKLRALPCQAHRNLVVRGLPDADTLFDLQTVTDNFEEPRENTKFVFKDEGVILTFQNLFPLLHALLKNTVSEVAKNIKKTNTEWAARALLETAIIKLQYHENREI